MVWAWFEWTWYGHGLSGHGGLSGRGMGMV